MLFSREEFATRIDKVVAGMKRDRIDALVAHASGRQPGEVRYLSGYESRLCLHDVTYFVLAPGADKPYTLLTNAFWDDHKAETWVDDIIIGSDFPELVCSCIPPSVRRIGIAGFSHIPAPVYIALTTQFPKAWVGSVDAMTSDARRLKSPVEIDALRRCAILSDLGGEAFLKAITPGVSEYELTALASAAILRGGADRLGNTIQVYSGSRTALGISFATNRVVEAGDFVTMDCGPVWHGYRGDLSRVTTAGYPSADQRRLMNTVADMYDKAMDLIRPGVRMSDVAQAMIDVADRAGMRQYLYKSPSHGVGFMGHGLGLHFSEQPEMDIHSSGVFEENMVMVVEPILGIPGFGGVKTEDALVVTSDGVERFSHLPIRTWVD
jgi:Xaa-Pro aminopeptidase